MLFLSPGITLYCLLLAAVLGASAASFFNCMAWRICREESVLRGRSHCDLCGHVLGVADLIPIASYVIHGGKCRYCHGKLSPSHLVYEIIGAVSFVLILLKFDISSDALEYLLLVSILMGASFTDISGYIIPNGFIVSGIIIRAVFIVLSENPLATLADSAIGGFAVAGVILLIVLVTEKVLKREAMGGGDIKLIFMLGLFLGWKRSIFMILVACVAGIVTGLITGKKREQKDSEDGKIFPWGPSLSIAAFVTLLCGEEIISAYLSLF